ncbi:hypothetical protein GCM10007852_39250 [Agaribacter marinus]|uniref:Uncharacterized protein n=1 Tax=Agaribacter marinus TaxID=1431249 RepID=A0AA37SZ85_9ALTE|nr:hypothetical protein GCM10007852_39250 [Agaribacter marinus]
MFVSVFQKYNAANVKKISTTEDNTIMYMKPCLPWDKEYPLCDKYPYQTRHNDTGIRNRNLIMFFPFFFYT